MIIPIQLTSIMLALVVGVLLGAGTFMILQRGQIRLILGLGLFSHGINLLLFGSGQLTRGRPDIIIDKANYVSAVAGMADPLPQALILTAIVISFGMTAFIVVLVSRRDALTGSDVLPGEMASYLNTLDPFAVDQSVQEQLAERADEDYDLLQYELDEVYDQPTVTLPFHEEG
ncbi:MAG: NADH-quinone oxidoreductase subunit K [Caldilineaceae bacterium]|nr:NADH-quinone oxidoreductase subunit K [Caldilineaceae bacterium]